MPIVGTICMDQCMVKLPAEMTVGEKVVLIGNQGKEEINMEEWAERLDTIPYEIAVSISKRIPRIYISERFKAYIIFALSTKNQESIADSCQSICFYVFSLSIYDGKMNL